MSWEAVAVKEEPPWAVSAPECGVSEAAARAGLYAGHAVKDELVVGPECLQPRDIAYPLGAVSTRVAVKSELEPALRGCSVRLERLEHYAPPPGDAPHSTPATPPLPQLAATSLLAHGITRPSRTVRARQRRVVCRHAASCASPIAPHESSSSVCAQDEADAEHHGHTIGADSYRCDVCGAGFILKTHLIKHVAFHIHVQEKHGCVNSACVVEGATPSPTPPPHTTQGYVCHACGKTFVYKHRLINHIRLHRSKESKKDKPAEKIFLCDYCGKGFPRLAALRVHMRIHMGEKPFACKICTKRFSRSDHFNDHNRLHAADKLFVCELCGRRFKLLDYLRKHKLVHGGKQGKQGKSFRCEICRKQFKQLSDLTRHQICHNVAKRFTCDTCDKQFPRAESLKRHTQIHTGEKSYSCETCQKKFRELHHVTRHKVIHTNEKRHKCDVCEKTFSVAGNLKQHKRTHTGEKPYGCGKCGTRFVRLDTFKAHTLKHTNEE